jgi:hypothetical protein
MAVLKSAVIAALISWPYFAQENRAFADSVPDRKLLFSFSHNA